MRTFARFTLCLAYATRLLPAGDRSNVVLILTDDQGYGDVSFHGNPVLKTPNIDRMAKEGNGLRCRHDIDRPTYRSHKSKANTPLAFPFQAMRAIRRPPKPHFVRPAQFRPSFLRSVERNKHEKTCA